MSSDEVHDAVAQYEGCSSIKVFATVEDKKLTVGKKMNHHGKLKVLESETEVEVASVTESREDMAENRPRGADAQGAETRDGVDSSCPRTEDHRPKKMLPRTTAKAAKKSMILQKLTQSPRKPHSPSSDLAAVHAIHTGKNHSSPPRTISTKKAVGRHPKTTRKSQDSSNKSVSSRSSVPRWSPASLQHDDSYESGRSSKSALFLRAKASPTVMHVPSTSCKDKVKSLRLQKIDGNNKKLIKLEKVDAAPRSFKITAPKKAIKPVPVPTKEIVPPYLPSHASRSANSSSPAPVSENRGTQQEINTGPPRSITPVNATMPPRPRQVAEIVNMLQAQNKSVPIPFSQRLGKFQQQQDRCTPTPSEVSTAHTEKIRNMPSGSTTSTTKSETKQQQQHQQHQQQQQQQPRPTIAKKIFRVEDILAMSDDKESLAQKQKQQQQSRLKNVLGAEELLAVSSSSRSGFSSGGGDNESLAHAEEEDGESSTGSRTTPTTSEEDNYEGEESIGSSTYHKEKRGAGSGRDAEAFSLNSILAGFYSF